MLTIQVKQRKIPQYRLSNKRFQSASRKTFRSLITELGTAYKKYHSCRKPKVTCMWNGDIRVLGNTHYDDTNLQKWWSYLKEYKHKHCTNNCTLEFLPFLKIFPWRVFKRYMTQISFLCISIPIRQTDYLALFTSMHTVAPDFNRNL